MSRCRHFLQPHSRGDPGFRSANSRYGRRLEGPLMEGTMAPLAAGLLFRGNG